MNSLGFVVVVSCRTRLFYGCAQAILALQKFSIPIEYVNMPTYFGTISAYALVFVAINAWLMKHLNAINAVIVIYYR